MTAGERRWTQGQRPAPRIEVTIDTEMGELKDRLTTLLGGPDEYYTWACTLSMNTVLVHEKYKAAIRKEIAYRECLPDMLDQERTLSDARAASYPF